MFKKMFQVLLIAGVVFSLPGCHAGSRMTIKEQSGWITEQLDSTLEAIGGGPWYSVHLQERLNWKKDRAEILRRAPVLGCSAGKRGKDKEMLVLGLALREHDDPFALMDLLESHLREAGWEITMRADERQNKVPHFHLYAKHPNGAALESGAQKGIYLTFKTDCL